MIGRMTFFLCFIVLFLFFVGTEKEENMMLVFKANQSHKIVQSNVKDPDLFPTTHTLFFAVFYCILCLLRFRNLNVGIVKAMALVFIPAILILFIPLLFYVRDEYSIGIIGSLSNPKGIMVATVYISPIAFYFREGLKLFFLGIYLYLLFKKSDPVEESAERKKEEDRFRAFKKSIVIQQKKIKRFLFVFFISLVILFAIFENGQLDVLWKRMLKRESVLANLNPNIAKFESGRFGERISDEDLVHLKSLANLIHLDLGHAKISEIVA